MKLNCIIVDDEPAGRKIIEEYIAETTFLHLIGQAENPVKAFELIDNNQVELIYLDVQMPKINGIDFLKSLPNPPMVILTTAFSEYALQGFELEVIDYLLKPIPLERFIKASKKAKDYFELKNKPPTESDYFFVKCNNKYEKICFDEVLYFKAANNYVIINTIDKKLITYLTFKSIEEKLPENQFIKVHKSFIISISKIDNLNGEEISIGKHTVPISRTLKEEVLDKIVTRRLVKR